MTAPQGCGAPAGGVAVTENSSGEAIIEGRVVKEGSPVTVGYARLLNDGGEFVAEVPLGEDGGFRFFAAPGTWTVRVLAPGGARADETVSADYGSTTTLQVSVSATAYPARLGPGGGGRSQRPAPPRSRPWRAGRTADEGFVPKLITFSSHSWIR